MSNLVTKFIRVAREGNTTDGRKISRAWIEQMARNYKRSKYGARIWLEHFRGLLPDGPFAALGDVLALKTDEDDEGKLCLMAQLAPTDSLVAMNQKKQKVYSSIEVDPDFAGSGEAYLVGLGVTDSPASLGTDALAFSSQHDGALFRERKQRPENVISAAEEFTLELEQPSNDPPTTDDPPSARTPTLFSRIQGLLKGKQKTDDQRFADVHQAVELLASRTQELGEAIAASDQLRQDHDALAAKHEQLQQDYTALKQSLDTTEDHSQQRRPEASGATGEQLAQF